MLKILKKKLLSLTSAHSIDEIKTRVKNIEKLLEGILIDDYISSKLNNEKYTNQKRLSRFYRSVYSQYGEDGIISEIFRRIGTTNLTFVEFGVHGFDNNTTFLLHKKWKGLWIEGNRLSFEQLSQRIGDYDLDNLKLREAFITVENFERILSEERIPEELDLLSIDIDGNDYYVLESLTEFKPRVIIIIEYNATFGATEDIVIEYDPLFQWQGDSYFGASLSAIVRIAKQKGYSLVCCDFSGSNAFLVRDDLLGDMFLEPYTAENHYEPPRYFIVSPSGHSLGFGKFRPH